MHRRPHRRDDGTVRRAAWGGESAEAAEGPGERYGRGEPAAPSRSTVALPSAYHTHHTAPLDIFYAPPNTISAREPPTRWEQSSSTAHVVADPLGRLETAWQRWSGQDARAPSPAPSAAAPLHTEALRSVIHHGLSSQRKFQFAFRPQGGTYGETVRDRLQNFRTLFGLLHDDEVLPLTLDGVALARRLLASTPPARGGPAILQTQAAAAATWTTTSSMLKAPLDEPLPSPPASSSLTSPGRESPGTPRQKRRSPSSGSSSLATEQVSPWSLLPRPTGTAAGGGTAVTTTVTTVTVEGTEGSAAAAAAAIAHREITRVAVERRVREHYRYPPAHPVRNVIRRHRTIYEAACFCNAFLEAVARDTIWLAHGRIRPPPEPEQVPSEPVVRRSLSHKLAEEQATLISKTPELWDRIEPRLRQTNLPPEELSASGMPVLPPTPPRLAEPPTQPKRARQQQSRRYAATVAEALPHSLQRTPTALPPASRTRPRSILPEPLLLSETPPRETSDLSAVHRTSIALPTSMFTGMYEAVPEAPPTEMPLFSRGARGSTSPERYLAYRETRSFLPTTRTAVAERSLAGTAQESAEATPQYGSHAEHVQQLQRIIEGLGTLRAQRTTPPDTATASAAAAAIPSTSAAEPPEAHAQLVSYWRHFSHGGSNGGGSTDESDLS
ncbi:hypothetical protein CDCA_CDCA13G3594 [Cyanidium caldarium]|uniref:Uncharacterized protein n=1 Tax=Cyanidium caldarium TaxID=2771 RepID=A0AAV9IZ75_CYACA|nr:hypothetical protein CDCA_CDCA13G3594 [Cyanidium caldarium]